MHASRLLTARRGCRADASSSLSLRLDLADAAAAPTAATDPVHRRSHSGRGEDSPASVSPSSSPSVAASPAAAGGMAVQAHHAERAEDSLEVQCELSPMAVARAQVPAASETVCWEPRSPAPLAPAGSAEWLEDDIVLPTVVRVSSIGRTSGGAAASGSRDPRERAMGVARHVERAAAEVGSAEAMQGMGGDEGPSDEADAAIVESALDEEVRQG